MGYETTIIKIAWYVRFYMELIVCFPLVILLDKFLGLKIKNRNVIGISMILLCWAASILSNLFDYPLKIFVTEYFGYLVIPVFGYYIAKEKLFEKAAYNISEKKINVWTELFAEIMILAFLFVTRGVVKEFLYLKLDAIYASIFIFTLFYLYKSSMVAVKQLVNKYLMVLGYYSLELWFIHAIFFIGNPTVQKIAYWPKYSILILIWTIVLLLPLAAIIQKIKQQVINYSSIESK